MQVTQTVATQNVWIQVADFLRAVGQVFVAIGRALIQIGQVIYEFFFR